MQERLSGRVHKHHRRHTAQIIQSCNSRDTGTRFSNYRMVGPNSFTMRTPAKLETTRCRCCKAEILEPTLLEAGSGIRRESRAQGVQGVVRVFEVHVHQILGAQCCVSGGEGMRNSKDAKLLDNWFFTLSTTMMLPAVMCLVEGHVLGRYTRSGTQVQLRSAIA